MTEKQLPFGGKKTMGQHTEAKKGIEREHSPEWGQKENKGIRCYNVIFPLWFLIFFPVMWLYLLPANFLIDSIILLLALTVMKMEEKGRIYKKTILGVWAFGFLADIIGSVFLLTSQLSLGEWWQQYITMPVVLNPWNNFYALLFIFIALLISAAAIFFFNYKFLFGRLFPQGQKAKQICLILAICTAPYFFFVPTEAWQKGWEDTVSRDLVPKTATGEFCRSGEDDAFVFVGNIPRQKLDLLNDYLNDGKKIKKPEMVDEKADFQILYKKNDTEQVKKVVDLYLGDNQLCYRIDGRYYQPEGQKGEKLLTLIAMLDQDSLQDNGWVVAYEAPSREKQLLHTDGYGNYYLYEADKDKTMLFSPQGEEYTLQAAIEQGLLSISDLQQLGFDIRIQLLSPGLEGTEQTP